ncbi:hypothetical protein [Glutamicibacter sp.]|jgi:hypothetical protein|uniref:hypothetical protein n=1 Tax=Glutamicibacter sp. TaxID=1931995 RepID=UPI002B48BCAF|nr:hypothetical protein [Glutamicibacter sp.]HJX78552.1 hypothetical protein [Glutamicibacter sp.]
MATATITGSLRTFGGANFNYLDPLIIFRPSSAHLGPSSIFSGPDVRVTPESDSSFIATLERTDTMLTAGAHYKVIIEWRNPGITGSTGPGVAQHDTGWQIEVLAGGGPIGDNARPPRPNFQMVIVSPTPPSIFFGAGAQWLQADPNDMNNPLNPANTGIYHQLRWED